jgi:hypothetical protein
MKNKDIKQFVESVAEIKELKPVIDGNFSEDETVVFYNGEWIQLDKNVNPTLGYKFIKLKDRTKLCELNCGDIVNNQVIEKRVVITPEPHWITYCKTCQHYLHPNGKDFVKGSYAIQTIYMAYFNNQNK